MDLVHRDDLPPEALEAFEAFIKEKFPGAKVVCAGDVPEHLLSERTKEVIASVEKRQQTSISEGRCFDCGKFMENWPPSDDGKLPEGWHTMRKTTIDDEEEGELMGFVCPECDREDGMIDFSQLPEIE